jgi:hypothetical protein
VLTLREKVRETFLPLVVVNLDSVAIQLLAVFGIQPDFLAKALGLLS